MYLNKYWIMDVDVSHHGVISTSIPWSWINIQFEGHVPSVFRDTVSYG